MKFTIFTPAYNRAYVLDRLYQSLRNQTCKDFEWLIVDDGSTDGTEALCATFKDDLFPVRYFKTANRGKHVAVNFGAKKAKGEWFFIVDSDDWLPADSISKFVAEEQRIGSPQVGVLCGMRHDPSGGRIGGDLGFTRVECTPFHFRYSMGAQGDLAEAVRTSVIREFPFPVFEGERFCPEAVLFNRIAKKYLTHYFNENVYYCKYLSDGLSAHIVQIRMKSWRASVLCYAEQAACPVPLSVKVRSWVNFWRFMCCAAPHERSTAGFKLPLYAYVFKPFGELFHIKDMKTLTRDK